MAEALAEALVRRGHRCTLVDHDAVAAMVRSRALAVAGLAGRGNAPTPAGFARLAGGARGPLGLRRLIRGLAARSDWLCRALPSALRALAPDLLVVDQMEPAGALAARHLDLPFVSLAAAVPVEPDPAVPSAVLPFRYDPSPAGLSRNRIAEAIAARVMGPLNAVLRERSSALGCGAAAGAEHLLSPLATLSQLSPGYDLPRMIARPTLHGCGPIRAKCENLNECSPRLPPSFIFATFGTLLGNDPRLFRRIGEACRRLGLPYVVAHGGLLDARDAGGLGADVVTDLLPLPASFAGARVTVTHGGLNTTLDSLVSGVPVLALPLAFDQPGVAARLVHAGAGLAIHPLVASTARIEAALARLIDDTDLRTRSAAVGAELSGRGGAERAADIVEAAARTGRPVILREAA